MITLQAEGRSTIKKSTTLVTWWGRVLAVTSSVMIATGYSLSPVKPTNGAVVTQIFSFSILICSNADKYKISAEMPLSISILWVQWLAIAKVTAKALSWGVLHPSSIIFGKRDIFPPNLGGFFRLFGGVDFPM